MTMLVAIVESVLRTLAFAGVVGMAIAVFRVRWAAVRLHAWRIVLYAALAMPVLGRTLPVLRVPVPAVPAFSELWAAATSGTAVDVAFHMAPGPDPVGRPAGTNGSRAASARASDLAPGAPSIRIGLSSPADDGRVAAAARASSVSWRGSGFPWSRLAVILYLLGVVYLFLRAGLGWAVATRLEGFAQPIEDAALHARIKRYAQASGLNTSPRLAASDRVIVPMTMSVLRPIVVLPSTWREWEAAKLDAVLAHEVAHVARRDTLTQRLSLVYRAVFWVSPFSWWLHHHLAELAEQVSDEAALSAGVDRATYAETLLGFFAETRPAPSRRAEWHVAMARGASAELRVDRILTWKDNRALRSTRTLALGVALAAAPVMVLAAAVRPEPVLLSRPRLELPSVPSPPVIEPAIEPSPVAMPAETPSTIDALTPAGPFPSMPVGSTTMRDPRVPIPPQPSAGQTVSWGHVVDVANGPLTQQSFAGHRVWILLFDTSAMQAADLQKAVTAARKWTDEKMSMSDLVAVASLGSTLQILQDFTNNRAKVHSILEDFARTEAQADTKDRASVATDPTFARDTATARQDADTLTLDMRVRGLRTLCENLSPIQAHKAILYFGLARSGTDNHVELRDALTACTQANTSLNPVDLRGLQTVGFGGALASSAGNEAAIAELLEVASQQQAVRAQTANTTPISAGFGQGAYRVGSGVTEPTLLKRPRRPLYTSEAMRAGLQGDVELEAVVLADGTVGETRVVRSLDTKYGLDEEAIRTARQWTFGPARANGQPVAILVTLLVQFRLDAKDPQQTVPAGPRPLEDAFADGAYSVSAAGIVAPQPLKKLEPRYTSDAMRLRLEGEVVVEAVVMPDGTVGKVRVVRSLDATSGGLDDQALLAVRQRTFVPATLSGRPVPVLVVLTLPFRLH
jgi:VWFA-related protein/TonB family protein